MQTAAKSAAQINRAQQTMPRRGIGFMLAHEQFTIPQLLEFGAAAEAAKFDVLATSDHFQPWQDNEGHSGSAWVTLAALALRTQSIWLGPTVTCPISRYNPAVVAEVFASLSALAPGRIFLGVGSGEALNEQAATGEWPAWSERSKQLIEATQLIQQLWSGEDVYHDGKFFTVEGKLYDPPVQPIPILMAANGPKAMLRAGRFGAGLITDPESWNAHRDQFEAGLEQAGKKLDDVPVLIEQFVVVGDSREVDEAAALWRFIPRAFKGYHNIADPRAIRARAEKEIPLHKVSESWSRGTDPEQHAQAIERLFESGATIVNIHAGQRDQNKAIEFYGEKVLPLVRRNVRAASA